MHDGHLMLPLRDDVLSQASKLFIMTVLDFAARDIDRSLMVRHHLWQQNRGRRRRLDRQSGSGSFCYRQVVVDYKLRLIAVGARTGRIGRIRLILCQGNGNH
jgi:hypothetical protein